MPDDVRTPAFDKSRLPSRHVTVGPERAPHRAFLHSLGLTDEQIAQPIIGIASLVLLAVTVRWSLRRRASGCAIAEVRT